MRHELSTTILIPPQFTEDYQQIQSVSFPIPNPSFDYQFDRRLRDRDKPKIVWATLNNRLLISIIVDFLITITYLKSLPAQSWVHRWRRAVIFDVIARRDDDDDDVIKKATPRARRKPITNRKTCKPNSLKHAKHI